MRWCISAQQNSFRGRWTKFCVYRQLYICIIYIHVCVLYTVVWSRRLFTLNHEAFCSIIKTTTCNYGQRDINVGLHRTWDVLINTLRYSTVYLWARCNTSFIMYRRIMNAGYVCVAPTILFH